MTNAAFGKKVFAIAVLACLCAALIAVPAYGFYYVHDDSVSDSSDGLGSYEVFMVVADRRGAIVDQRWPRPQRARARRWQRHSSAPNRRFYGPGDP